VCEERETINKKKRSNDEREEIHVRNRNIKGQQRVSAGEKVLQMIYFQKIYRFLKKSR